MYFFVTEATILLSIFLFRLLLSGFDIKRTVEFLELTEANPTDVAILIAVSLIVTICLLREKLKT